MVQTQFEEVQAVQTKFLLLRLLILCYWIISHYRMKMDLHHYIF